MGIHDIVGECDVAREVSSYVTGVLAGVQGNECVLGEFSQFRPFHFLSESLCCLF